MSETIMMIHGMWGGSWYWENYKTFFEKKGYTCVAPILRFHDMDPKAKPDPRLGKTSLVDYAADLEKDIRSLGTTPILMGHSMGGLLAQMLGSRGLAKALVLLTPAPPQGVFAMYPSVVLSFASMMLKLCFLGKPGRQTFNEAVFSMLALLPPDEQRKAYDRFVYESGKAATEIGFSLRASQFDEKKVTCPVLVISGKKDHITPAPVVHNIAKKYIKVSTYKEFANHAHWVVAEPGWQEVAEFAGEWLDKVVGKDGH